VELVYHAVCLCLKKALGVIGDLEKKHLVSSLSIMFDSWTDLAKKNSFIALICHWFYDDETNWDLQSAVFDIIPFKGGHTAEQLALAIGYCLQDCPSLLLYCGVTDNAANVVKACNLILNDLWENPEEINLESLEFEETGFHCIDHSLDLVIHKSVELNEILHKDIQIVQEIVNGIRRSPQKHDILKNIQSVLGECPLELKVDVKTHWNSVTFMLERFLQVKDALIIFHWQGHLNDLNINFPDEDSFVWLSGCMEILSPLEAISRFLEGQKYSTICHIPFILDCIFKFLGSNHQELVVVKDFHQTLFQKSKKMFESLLTIVNESLLATALHPAYGHLDFISSNIHDSMWRKIENWAEVLFGNVAVEGEDLYNENILFGNSMGRIQETIRRLRH